MLLDEEPEGQGVQIVLQIPMVSLYVDRGQSSHVPSEVLENPVR